MEELKNKIDSMSYDELVELWRHAPNNNEFFSHKDVCNYFRDSMYKKRDEIERIEDFKKWKESKS